jgi:hypothetical protein
MLIRWAEICSQSGERSPRSDCSKNVNTWAELATDPRDTAIDMGALIVVVQLDDEHTINLPRIPMEKSADRMKNSSDGRSLEDWYLQVQSTVAVVDCRSKIWEHGQFYVALSRVRTSEGYVVSIRRMN